MIHGWSYLRTAPKVVLLSLAAAALFGGLFGLALMPGRAHAESEFDVPPIILGNIYVATDLVPGQELNVGDEFTLLIYWRTPNENEAGCLPITYGQAPNGPKQSNVMVSFPSDVVYGIAAPPNNVGGTGVVGQELKCGQTGTSLYKFRVSSKRPEWWRNPTETLEVFIPQPVRTSPTTTLALSPVSVRLLTFTLAH